MPYYDHAVQIAWKLDVWSTALPRRKRVHWVTRRGWFSRNPGSL